MKQMKVEMGNIKGRIDNLETEKNKDNPRNGTQVQVEQVKNQAKGKEREIQTQGPVNNRGLISTYDRSRRDVARKFDQQTNTQGKRVSYSSEDYVSTTSPERNIFKARKQNPAVPYNITKSTDNGRNNVDREIADLKDSLKKK